jgi:TP901 family phage tail tape measure protein
MAEEQIVTRIVATSDFSNLIADLGKVSSALTNLQTKLNATNKNLAAQVAVMNRSFADTLRSTGQFSTHFVNLTSDVDKFGSQLDKGQIKLKQFFQVYQGHLKTNGGLIRQLAQQQVQLQNAILQPLGKNAEGLMQYNVHIPTGLDKVKSKTALARQELQIMNRVVQEGANSLINWGKNTQWAGRQLTVGLTVPLAAFGAASAKAFREADQELTRLTKVYGGLAATSASDLGKIRKQVTETASELSKAYGSSFKETIALGADIAATGKQGNELLGSIKETTRLAVLGEVDRQDAMKATLAIQSAFKQNTDELAESINFLNAVENQTSTTLNDLVEAIPKAGPIIKGLGGSVEDLALYLTAMREGGINASEGANALKSGLASLINPTKVAKEMFAGFGISLTDIVQKNAGNTTNTLLALQSALDNLDPLQKQQALEQLFGKFQFARMNALFENLGKQGSQTLQVMDLMKASSQDLANIAGRELSMVTESASGKYRRALEGLKADLAVVGEQFLTINTHLINIVSGILKFIDKLPGPIKTILAFFGGLTAVAGPLIMLTGVLANFFGYVIKGASHFRAMFKGGEGWRLLTPEILAANKAGSLAEQTFYSDAKAADILNQAISRLSASYNKLAADASNAIIQTNPGVSTMGGTNIIAGQRVVNPNHPLVGEVGTRAASHHNPRALMSKGQRDAQTIHSVTPGSIDVNQKIGTVPQIFMAGDLPKIEGLTSSRGASTGIVAGEAAKWHSLMGTLSMMTKREVADLKKEIARTGTFSTEINTTFGQLLPAMTKITTNAASQSALIVQQLQAGKITLDTARAKIIAINSQLEAMMAQTTAQVAADLGRTANLTQVPLINQPIVGPTGKANIKEIFRPNRPASKIIDKIARSLGVRTYGAGYSTETTMPKKFATGGMVVPGPRSDTTDTQFMNLVEGDIVLNRKASDNLMGYNQGGKVVPAMVTPGEIIINNPTPSESEMLLAYNNQFAVGGRVVASKNNYGIPSLVAKYAAASKIFSGFRSPGKEYYRASRGVMDRTGSTTQSFSEPGSLMRFNDYRLTRGSVYKNESNKNYGITPTLPGQTLTHAYSPSFIKRLKKMGYGPDDNIPVDVLKSIGVPVPSGAKYVTLKALSSTWVKTSKRFNEAIKSNLPETNTNGTGWRDNWEPVGPESMQSLLIKLKSMGVMPIEAKRISEYAGTRLNGFVSKHKGPMTESDWGRYVNAAEIGGINDSSKRSHGGSFIRGIRSTQQNRYNKEDSDLLSAMNMGGKVRGYNRGGVVGGRVKRGKNNYGIPSVMGNLGTTAAYIGGSTAGAALGQKAGGNLGSLAGMILVPTILQSIMQKLGQVSAQGTSTAGILGRLGPLLANPYVAAGAAIVGVTAALIKFKKNQEESAKLNRLAFSGGVKPIKDFDSQLKQVTKTIEDTRATAALLHAQMNTAGLSGLTLTIKQFADLREKVKSTYPELVKLFKETPSDKLITVAQGLKAQFVAAGESAAQANAKIAALLAESGKSGFIQIVLGDKGLAGITSAKTAIESMLVAMSKFTDSKDRAAGLLQIFSSMGDYIENATDKSLALKEQYNAIEKSGQGNVKLTQDLIVEISKTSPGLAEILSTSDDVETALSKWRIVLGGVQKDLSGLDKGQLKKLAFAVEEVTNNYNKLLDVTSKKAQENSLTGKMAKDIDAFNKKQATASKTAIQNLETQISLKNKQIEQIKKEGDERKKALRDQQQSEDIKLQIQQEQLNYQTALAKGDMVGAAQAQISIQRLVGAQQLKVAEDAIDKAVQSKIDALQAQIDVLNKKSTAVSNAASTAKPKESPLTGIYQQIQGVYKDRALENITEEEALTQLNDLIKKLERTPGGNKYLKDLGVTESVQNITRDDGQTIVGKINTDSVQGNALLNSLKKGSDVIAGKQLVVLQQILAVLKNEPGKTYTPTQNQTQNAGATTAAGGTYAVGTIKNYTDSASSIKSAALKAFSDSSTGRATVGNRTYRLFKWNDRAYGIETSSGMVYDWDTNSNTIGKTLILDASKKSNFAMGGYVKNYEKGSPGGVKGPGTATSDSIPAMLSNGEYVVKSSSVNKYGIPFFDAVNAQKFAEGGSASAVSKTGFSGKGGQLMDWKAAWKEANKKVIQIKIPPITANFDTNSFELNKEQKLELEVISKDLINNQLKSIIIQGHTDSVGKEKDNDILSQNRAKAIAEYLSKLVPGTSFVPVGYGEYKPIAPNTNSENMAKNRRAELFLPDKYKTIYPEYNPKKHTAMITGTGKSDFSGGSLSGGQLSSSIDFGKLFNKIKLGLGFANGGAVQIPKFEHGINSVPANMLALLHKNEAVIPSNMNPFNPNANNATMGTVYNVGDITMKFENVHEMDGKKLFKEFKTLLALENTKTGPSRVIA